MLKIKTLVLVLLLSQLMLLIPAFSQDDMSSGQIKSVQGQVTMVDSFGPRLSLQWNSGDNSDELTFSVGKGCNIRKGGVRINLSDIIVNDHVSVQYYNNDFGGLKAVNITVGN